MENTDGIVVYSSFDSAIEANLAKTKLDAFGIPCFLTEEHMSSLYPGQRMLGLQVRLHVFNKDVEEVSRILMQVESFVAGDVQCPKCQSEKIIRDFPRALSAKALPSLIVGLFGILLPAKKVNHCLDCDYEF